LITNYLMKPAERFRPLAQQTHLIEELGRPSPDGVSRGRIGVDFGSIGLCHVAAGFSDAMIVGELLIAGAGRVDVLRALSVEHLLQAGVAGDALDAGEGVVASAYETDVVAGLKVAQVGVLDADLDGLAAVGDQIEVATVEVHLAGAHARLCSRAQSCSPLVLEVRCTARAGRSPCGCR
jgi:hypothetical protein